MLFAIFSNTPMQASVVSSLFLYEQYSSIFSNIFFLVLATPHLSSVSLCS